MDAKDAVSRVQAKLNISSLKAKQTECIHKLLDNKHVFCVLPTGYGKTLCFVVPPLALDEIDPTNAPHICIVVSPLRSLMMNQVQTLTAMNVKCLAITRREEMDSQMITDLKEGRCSLVFSSPEALLTDEGRCLLRSKPYKERLSYIVFDEAHCISEWGEDFRPEYKEVSILRSLTSNVPVAAFTGTCTENLMADILSKLLLSGHLVNTIALLPDRPNLMIHVEKVKNYQKEIKWYFNILKLEGRNAPKAIIYCRSMKVAAEIYAYIMKSLGEIAWLTPARDPTQRLVDMYHSSCASEDQLRVTTEFPKAESPIRVVIATIAFGMGVDIPDIRYIFHWGPSKTPLAYWQEIGRCCRDGQQGHCYLFIPAYSLDPRRVDENMKALCTGSNCIRVGILEHLKIHAMDISDLSRLKERQACKNKCDNCQCQFCLCCSRCKIQCPCC